MQGCVVFDINRLFFTASPGEHDGRVAEQRVLSRRILGVLCTLATPNFPKRENSEFLGKTCGKPFGLGKVLGVLSSEFVCLCVFVF